MIKISIEIDLGKILVFADLPEDPPDVKDCVRALACIQFDQNAQSVMIEKIKLLYGEEYYYNIESVSSEMVNSIKELLIASISSSPEMPAVPTILIANKGLK